MSSLLALIAPVALALPAAAHGVQSADDLAAPAFEPSVIEHKEEPLQLDPREGPLTESEAIATKREALEALYTAPVYRQVTIERRVIIRVSPRRRAPRTSLMAEQLQEVRRDTRYLERKMDDCVSVNGIAGVQPGSGDRLVLYMRDRRMVSAKLEKSCRARDFYSGFYVERNEDGKLCIARDKLQSRSGANCELTRMRELVPED